MKGFVRDNPLFSLCGLNCALCSLYAGGHCPGCGGGDGNQSCSIARCSLLHGGVAYCFLCGDYPCARYESFAQYDSFISTRYRTQDIERAKRIGTEAYTAELEQKRKILCDLIARYNDGRHKTLFATAVCRLPLADLTDIAARLAAEPGLDAREPKARALFAADLLERAAAAHKMDLKLMKKPGGKSRN